jgi:hypothetical protein
MKRLVSLFVIKSLSIFAINAQTGTTNPDLNKCSPPIPLAPPYGTSYFNPSNPSQVDNLKQHSESLADGSIKNCNWDCRTEYYFMNYTTQSGGNNNGAIISPFYSEQGDNTYDFGRFTNKDFVNSLI